MRRHITTLLLLFLCFYMSAYESNNFNTLDVKSGISDNYIQKILRDKYGFMWFATKNGLDRYDGYHFKQYTTRHLGTYDNSIEWISEDASGTIWIKTPVNYCFYDREKDIFNNDLSKKFNNLDIKESISQFFIDADKNIWFITENSILYYRFSEDKLSRYEKHPDQEILDLTCRSGNVYFLLSNGTISSINRHTNTIENITSINLRHALTHHIYIDTEQRLWLYATHGSDLICYSTKERRWIDYPGKKDITKTKTIITNVEDDGKGNIWIGTDNKGIIVSSIDKEKISHIYKKSDKLFSLPNNHITCFFKDEKDIMWIGTSKQGVTYTCLNSINFENHLCTYKEDVSSLLEDNNGNLWLGYDGEGIACCNKNGTYNNFRATEGAIPSDIIVCSFLDSKNRIWWGSFGEGPFYYKDGRFVYLRKEMESDNSEFPLYIRRITEDKNGNLWFATFTQGLFCMEKNGSFTNYNNKNSKITTNYIADLSYSEGSKVFIGTSSGLFNIDIYTREIEEMTTTENGDNIILEDFVNCLYSDSQNMLWIGGRKGLNIYDRKNEIIYTLSTQNGLSNNNIRAIQEDENKNIWVATDHGITHINIFRDHLSDDYKFLCFPYFEEDGIGNYTFNNFSILCNRSNSILIGGSGGYLKIDSDISNFRSFDQKIIFTGLYLENKIMNVGEKSSDGRVILKKNILLLDDITLDYSDKNFALEVSAMDYANNHKLQYMYRFSDKDEWMKLEGNRIYFNKLSPGTYFLQVKVNEMHSYKSNTPTYFTIHVKPPFWFSITAYFIYICIMISVIIFFVMRMFDRHKRMLDKQRKEMEIIQKHEMDEEKIKFFTNISHDIRTPLSLIITPLEKLMAQKNGNSQTDELNLIHRNAVILMDEVNQLLDFRKIDQKKMQVNYSFCNFSAFVSELCDSMKELFIRQNIKFNIEIKESDIDTCIDKNKMKRVVMNILSNAIKYNSENGSVNLILEKINSDNNKEEIRITISDTGIGIKDENKEKIFDRFFQENKSDTPYVGSGIGLHIVKEYLTLHKGKIRVEDNNPRGSVFIMTFPIMSKEDIDPALLTEMNTAEQTAVTEKPVSIPVNGDKITLLIVEDNIDLRTFLFNCFKDRYNIFEASDGLEALEILSQNSIQLVVSDVMMPNMDGMELCQKIKKDIRFSHIPVILLTARTAEEHVLSGLKEGADDYITKPFNLEILTLRIEKILKWSASNHENFRSIDISPAEITVSKLDEQLIEKAIKTVEDNIDNSDFSVEELSSAVGMSRGHLYKKLTAITGKTPIEFIRILRLKRGKQLLEESQMSISEVAYQVGLSPKQFSKYFKEEYGAIPSSYKKDITVNIDITE